MLNEYVVLTNKGEVESYEEAIFDKHKEKWLQALQDKLNFLHENKTYELAKLAKLKGTLKNMWVFRINSYKSTL